MSKKKVNIAWDKSKHDERIDADLRKKAMQLVGYVYQKWKQKLLRKPVPRDAMTSKLIELRDEVMKEIGKHKELQGDEWSKFCTEIVEVIIDRWHASGHIIGHRNEIEQYIPSWAVQEKKEELILIGDQPKITKFSFRTSIDLGEIPFIKETMAKPGFLFWVTDHPWLVAVFNDGEPVPVGKMANSIGVEGFPTLTAFKEELAKKKE